MRKHLHLLGMIALTFAIANPSEAYRSRKHPEKVQVSRLPTCDAVMDARIVAIDDGASATDCATGGGATPVLCFCDNGSGWSALGGGSFTPTAGISTDHGAGAVAALSDIGDLCAANEILERNAGDTAWACIATPSGGGGSPGGSQYDAQYNDGASGFTTGPHITDADGDALFPNDNATASNAKKSVKIGDGTVSSGYPSVAIGSLVDIGTNANTVAIGANNDVTANNTVSIGYDNDISGQYSATVGALSATTGARMACVGYNCDGTGQNSIGMGASVQLDYATSGAFGRNAANTAVNQLVFGSDLYRLRYVYFGGGPAASDTAASSVFLYATSFTGTNKQGGSIVLSGGTGTGSANSGEVHIRTAAGGASGSSQNATGTVAKWYASDPGMVNLAPIATAPSCSTNGDIYIDTSGAFCYCDGTSWNNLGGKGTGSCT